MPPPVLAGSQTRIMRARSRNGRPREDPHEADLTTGIQGRWLLNLDRRGQQTSSSHRQTAKYFSNILDDVMEVRAT